MADKRVAEVLKGARADLARAKSSADREQVHVKYLGRQGILSRLLRSLPSLPVAERPDVGRQANRAKAEIESLLGQRLPEVKAAERRRQLLARRVDLTLPGRRPTSGTLHPLTQVQDEIIEIFLGLGFAVAEGPTEERHARVKRGSS